VVLMNMNQAAIWRSTENGTASDCKARTIPSRSAEDHQDMVHHPATEKDARTSSASHQSTMFLPNLEKALSNSHRDQTSLLDCIRLRTMKGCSGAIPSNAPSSMSAFFFFREGRYPTRNLVLPPPVHPQKGMDVYHQIQHSLQARLTNHSSLRDSPT